MKISILQATVLLSLALHLNAQPSTPRNHLDQIIQIISAAESGNNEKIKLLLETNADIINDNLNDTDILKAEALVKAAENGLKGTVEILLQNNANVNAKDYYGRPALTLAAKNGYKDTVNVLLQYNANVNAKTGKGETALILAPENGHNEVIKMGYMYKERP